MYIHNKLDTSDPLVLGAFGASLENRIGDENLRVGSLFRHRVLFETAD